MVTPLVVFAPALVLSSGIATSATVSQKGRRVTISRTSAPLLPHSRSVSSPICSRALTISERQTSASDDIWMYRYPLSPDRVLCLRVMFSMNRSMFAIFACNAAPLAAYSHRRTLSVTNCFSLA